jgi:protease IV
MDQEQYSSDVLRDSLNDVVKERRCSRRWGIFFKIIFYTVVISIFLSSMGYLPRGDDKDNSSLNNKKGMPHTALVRIDGQISVDEAANADAVAAGLRAAFEAKEAKGIIISINSIGGSPVQSEYMYHEIKRLKEEHKDKTVIAVIGDVGASAAYLVASAADLIYSNEQSLVGSIGVVMSNYGVVDLMKKIGVDNRTVTGGEHKNFFDPASPLSDFDKDFAQKLVNISHQRFIKLVKEGRGSRLKDDPELFSGLVWLGEQALPLGLVDGFGSPGMVARDIIKADMVRDYTQEDNFIDKIAKRLGAALDVNINFAGKAPLLN